MSMYIRIVVLVGAALVAALAFSAGVATVLDLAQIKAPRTTLDVLNFFRSRLDEVKSRHGIAYLSDSIGMSATHPKYAIPGRIDTALREIPEMPPVISLADSGMGPVDFYLLAAEVAEARPAAIILSLNLGALSDMWVEHSSHPEFASAIGASRWLEAFGLPLDTSGVQTDQLVLYPLLEELGLFDKWLALTRYQARVLKGWRKAEALADGPDGPLAKLRKAAIQSALGTSLTAHGDGRDETLRLHQINRYSKATTGVDKEDPSLQLLSATLRYWQSVNVPVLVVVIPINVELLRSLGIDDEEGTARTLAVLAEVARSAGAEILDLHDLLPAESFSDRQGHYTLGADQDGPSTIAPRIVPALVSMIRANR